MIRVYYIPKYSKLFQKQNFFFSIEYFLKNLERQVFLIIIEFVCFCILTLFVTIIISISLFDSNIGRRFINLSVITGTVLLYTTYLCFRNNFRNIVKN